MTRFKMSRFLQLAALGLTVVLVMLGSVYYSIRWYVNHHIEAVRRHEYRDLDEAHIIELLGQPEMELDEQTRWTIPSSPPNKNAIVKPMMDNERILMFRTSTYFGLDKGRTYIWLTKKNGVWICDSSKYIRDGVVF